MKIAVVKPPSKEKYISPLITLDYGIVTACLINEGYSPDQINLEIKRRVMKEGQLNLEIFSKKRRSEYINGKEDQEIKKELKKLNKLGELSKYNVLCFSVQHYKSFEFLLPLFKYLKKQKPDITIILGGKSIEGVKDASILSKYDFLNFVVLGNSEHVLTRLIENLDDFKELDGVYNSGECTSQSNENRVNINDQPIPYFKKSDIKIASKLLPYQESYIPYQLGRGCVNNCTFCSYDKKPVQKKDVNKIVEEIKILKERYNSSNFFFVDSNIFNYPGHLEEIASSLGELDIRWGGQASIVKKNIRFYKKLRSNGCLFLAQGLESASNKILKLMRKPYNKEMARKAVKRASKAGIKTDLNIIVGFPKETEEDFKETATFIKNHSNYIFNLNIFQFFLNTNSQIYQDPERYGLKIQKDPERDDKSPFRERSAKYTEKDKSKVEDIKQRRQNTLIRMKWRLIYLSNFKKENSFKLLKFYRNMLSNATALQDVSFFIF